MSTHDRMETLADLHAVGALTPDERHETDAHVASCASCAALLRDAARFHHWATGALAPDAPPEDLEGRIVSRLRASSAIETRRWRFLPGKRLLKVVGGLAAAAVFVFLGNGFAKGPDPAIASGLMAKIDQATESFNTDYSVFPPASQWSANGWDGYTNESLNEENSNKATKLRFNRDLSRVKDYNSALDRDNAQMRFKSKADRTPKGIAALEENGDKNVLQDKLAKIDEPTGATGKGKPDPATALVEPEKAEKAPERGLDDAARKVAEQPIAPEPRPADPTPNPQAQDNRKIIRTADVDVEVDSYEAASAKLNAMVADEKGFVATANTQRLANGKIRAVVTVRVAPERLDPLLAKLKMLGTVRHQNIGSSDVTRAYVDLEARRGAKEAFLERLKKLLAEAKGSAKELLEVEVQMGKTIEEIEAIKGELKYYDNQVSLSTLTLTISEKDLGQPFEYVQTLQSAIGLTARDADDAYAKAQKEVTDVGGQVVDSKMNRQNDGSATGTIRARVDAEKFPALRESLKRLGRVTNDTVNQQKTARGGGDETPKVDAPLKKEQAVIDLTITTPPIVVTHQAKLLVETPAVQDAYQAARRAVEAAGGKIVSGSLVGRANGTEALVVGEVDAERFAALVDQFKSTGKLKNSAVKHDLPAATPDGQAPLLRERATVELTLVSPPELIGEEHGIGKIIRDTFAGSWGAVLWSIEKLFVGLSLAGPWLALLAAGWFVWRKTRKKKSGATT